MKLKPIREFFWPPLDPLPTNRKKPEEISINDIDVPDENIETTYSLALSYYKQEEERKSSVESKSTIFIGTLGVTITIILAVAKLLSDSFTFNNSFLLTMLVFVSLYLCRSLWFSIKALERKEYHCLNYNDFVTSKNSSYLKGLIVKLINNTNKNSITINEKVDYMTMAQEYFKRAVVTIIIYNFFFLFFYFIKNSFCLRGISILFKKLLNYLSLLNLNPLLIIGLYALVLLNYILMGFLYRQFKRLKNTKTTDNNER